VSRSKGQVDTVPGAVGRLIRKSDVNLGHLVESKALVHQPLRSRRRDDLDPRACDGRSASKGDVT
jgi:hypothetical protein